MGARNDWNQSHSQRIEYFSAQISQKDAFSIIFRYDFDFPDL